MDGEPMRSLARTSSAAPRLKTTLAAAFSCFSIVVLFLYSGLETFNDFNTLSAVISNKQRLTAQEAAKTVSSFVEENFSVLETSIWLTNLDAASEAEQRQVLQSLLGLRSALRRLELLDDRNQLMARASRLSMREWVPLNNPFEAMEPGQAPRSKRRISPVHIDPVTGEPMVTLAVPVNNAYGDFRGTLIAELNLKFMWDIVDQLQVGRTGYAYVADRMGNLLAFHDTARVLKRENVSHLKAVADFTQAQAYGQTVTATRYRGILGTTVVGTYVPLKTPDWAVVIEMPWGEAYQEVLHEVATSVGMTVALAALAGFFGVLVARRLAAPMINLTETAARIASGERELQASAEGPREVVRMAEAFNSMTGQLQQSLENLEQRFEDLERTEAALSLSEERLRLALEGTFDGIWDWNIQTGKVYFSPRYYTMMGYEPGEFPGHYESWRRLVHPDDLEAAEKAVFDAVDNHTSFAVQFRFKEKGGEYRWILARGKVAESGEEGRAVRMAGSHTDITQRKIAEEALRKYERIVSTTQDLMALVNRNYTYEAVNDSFLAAHLKRREEVVGRTIPEVRGEMSFRQEIQGRMDQAFSGCTVHFQAVFDFAGLGQKIMDVTYFPMFDPKGIVEGVVINARDITETRKMEERLMQSQRIEAIGTLAGGVAHEINNPINGIMNYAQLILDGENEEGPTSELAREILHETERIAGIVKNLLTFARHEKQSHSSALLSDIVTSVLSLIQTVMRHDQIILELSIPEDLPKIKCRTQQIQQVLMNLMTNGRDALNERYPGYSPEKKLRVSAEVILKEDRRFIRTTVEDWGSGIRREIQGRIFDPFFTTKPKETGTGLGLSISYGIVKDHGGELSVESEPGKPTRFHMDLAVDNGWALPDK
jgi:PAS domain S-box-containing protein